MKQASIIHKVHNLATDEHFPMVINKTCRLVCVHARVQLREFSIYFPVADEFRSLRTKKPLAAL